jgi:hypothetical protein
MVMNRWVEVGCLGSEAYAQPLQNHSVAVASSRVGIGAREKTRQYPSEDFIRRFSGICWERYIYSAFGSWRDTIIVNRMYLSCDFELLVTS